MSDQPENNEAPTAQIDPVEPAPVQSTPPQDSAGDAPLAEKPSNKRAIWAAAAGAGAVLLLVLAGFVGFALGSHHDDRGRDDFGRGQSGQMRHGFDGDHGGMMGQYGQNQPDQFGPMMGQQGGQQGYGPGQLPQGMTQAPQTQQ